MPAAKAVRLTSRATWRSLRRSERTVLPRQTALKTGPSRSVGESQATAHQTPVSAFTRPEATAAWSASKSRSFWSA